MKNDEGISNWAINEFGKIDFCDKRLSNRLLKLADSFVKSPESTINKACNNWSETKAAYRFFQNENVDESKILGSHVSKTIQRCNKYETILAIQDTSYISYKDHKKTTGLGVIASRVNSSSKNFKTFGLVMHTSFAISTDGLPLGLLDQKINARKELSQEIRDLKKKSHNNALPIEEKESIRWLETLTRSNKPELKATSKIVTICDREGDIYELFELACRENNFILIRAGQNRIVNKKSLYSMNSGQRLWELAKSFPVEGELQVTVPAKEQEKSREARLEVRFGKFTMHPSRNNCKHKTTKLPNLKLNLIYVLERNASEQTDPLEWMLITNLSINNFENAVEKIKWYCLRWRIGVSRLRTLHLVGERPIEVKDSSLVAREASWSESKTMEPSDNIFRKEYAQCTRL